MDPAVELRGVEKRFGRTLALRGVDLSIGSGVTGLLGPNGAGKTTLLRTVATVLRPDAGTVRVLGRDLAVDADRVAVRRRLGYVPQEPGFHRSFTTFEHVDHLAILKEWHDRRARHAEVRRVLQLVELEAHAGRRVRALSGGMRRRIAIAQALLGDPALLVLDEPTAGLDPEQRLRFRELISAVAERHAVVLSTHQTEDVAALCDHVVVVEAGQVRFEGRPDELVARARGRVWRDHGHVDGAQLSYRTGDGSYRVLGAEPPEAADLLPPTLEDAYLLLIGGDRDVVAGRR